MRFATRFGFLLLIVSLLMGAGSGAAFAQDELFLPQLSAPLNDGLEANVEYVVPPEIKAAAMNYASAETFASVPPLPWYDEAPVETEGVPLPTGEVSWHNGGLPDPNARNVAKAEFAEAWAAIDEAELAEAIAALEEADAEFTMPEQDYTGSTHTSIRGNYHGRFWDAYPFHTVGKLYIYRGGSYQGYCSASVIGQKNIIVTAAHCTYDRGTGWFDEWAFVPADRGGVAPYGVWWGDAAIVRGPWPTSGGRNYDVSLVRLDYQYHDGGWRPVSYFTGWLGRVQNLVYQQHLVSVGYPSNIDGGVFSHLCMSETYYGGYTDYISMGCDMTFGSSGGPWIWKFHPYRSWWYNYVDSVVSGGVPGTNIATGPRFSSDNIGSLCTSWDCGISGPRP